MPKIVKKQEEYWDVENCQEENSTNKKKGCNSVLCLDTTKINEMEKNREKKPGKEMQKK